MAYIKLNAINPCILHHIKATKDIVVGGVCEALLLQEPLKGIEERFRLDIFSFLVEFSKMIKLRFDLSESCTLAK